MTNPIVQPDDAAKRAAKIAAIRNLADWLTDNPAAPVPTLDLHRHLGNNDGTEAENLATVRSLAVSLGVDADEELDDRTVLRVRVNEHVWYELFAWHKSGRDALGELERLRAEVAELRSGAASTKPDATGLGYSRTDGEPDDPTPVSPARVPLHTGGMVGPLDGGELVDETEPAAEHRHAGGSAGGFGENSAECACGTTFDGFDTPAEATKLLALHIEAATSATGLTRAADQTRGVLAFTTPVVAYFSFGHGQSDPRTGKRLLDHYVTIVAPTYEECREAMLGSRFGRAWSFDYLAGTARATEWIPRWTEHEVIVAPGTDKALAESALNAARELLTGEDNERAKQDAGRVSNLNLARYIAEREDRRRYQRHYLGLEESAKHNPAELKPWESNAPLADRIAESMVPIADGAEPLVSDETIAEAAAMEERDRLAGGPPWEVPDHPDHNLPGGWHHGQIR